MNINFRVDASIRIGTGHVMRCLTLADALARHGAECRFIHRAHPGHMAEVIQQRDYAVALLPAPQGCEVSADEDKYAHWLGVTPEQDAKQTLAAFGGLRSDWLVVDHYALDTAWEGRLRFHVEHVAVIDDLANRPHDADLLLDQNYSTEGAARYNALLPTGTIRLCGPSYALLHPAYCERRCAHAAHSGQVKRVLVFFGGSDADNLTGRALEALSAPEFAAWHVDAVVGTNNPHRRELEVQVARRRGVSLYGPQAHLADLMAAADLAIGAGGATTWERCCLGLPSLVVSIADNQRPACEALAADGLIAYGGNHEQVTVESLRTSLLELVSEPERLQRMAIAGWQLVDGCGAERVAGKLMEWGG